MLGYANFGLYIASSDLLEISQHSTRELYLNCPITMAPVHHWPELILMNLSENPINLEAGEVIAKLNLHSPKACVMIATDLSILQNKMLCAEEAVLLSEQNKLGACVSNAMAHLATLTADLSNSRQTYFKSQTEKANHLTILSQTAGITKSDDKPMQFNFDRLQINKILISQALSKN